jgi:hypothetical protein
MPYKIPGLNIDWNTCLAQADEPTQKQFEAIRDLFNSLKNIEEKDCEHYFFKTLIEKGHFSFYLVGGRATFLVLNTLNQQGRLRGSFWENFDWTSFQARLAKDNDFDIQFALNEKERIWFPHDVHLSTFMDNISAAIKGTPPETKGVDKKHIACNNDMIDVATQIKNTDSLDITNTTFRINLITGEVTCFSKSGLDLLIYQHTVDMPNLSTYMVPSKRKQRADFSKIVFMLRNFEKFISSNFVLSDANRSILSVKLNMDYNAFKKYLEKKIQRLKHANGDSKTNSLVKTLGDNSDVWIQNLVLLSDENKSKTTITFTARPASTLEEILSHVEYIKKLNQTDTVNKSQMVLFIQDVLKTCILLKEEDLDGIYNNLTGYTNALSLISKKKENMRKKSLSPEPSPISNEPQPATEASSVKETWQPSVPPKRKYRNTVEDEKIDLVKPLVAEQLHQAISENEKLFYKAYKIRSFNLPIPNEFKKIGANLGKAGKPPLANPKDAYAFATNIFWVSIIMLTLLFCYLTPNQNQKIYHDPKSQLVCLFMAAISVLLGCLSYNYALLPNHAILAEMGLEHNLELLHTQAIDRRTETLDLRLAFALVIYYGAILNVYTKNEPAIKLLVSEKLDKSAEGISSLIHNLFALHALPSKKYQFICDISNALTTLDKKSIFLILEQSQFEFNRHTSFEEMKTTFHTLADTLKANKRMAAQK